MSDREALRRKLLANRLAAHKARHSESLTVSQPGVPVPLSNAQQRLWFADSLNPGNTAYNIPAAYRLRGALDVQALIDALDAIVARHDILRTTFEEGPVETMQVVRTFDQEDYLERSDRRGLNDAGRTAAIDAASRAFAHHVFDLRTGPLFRFHLMQLADDDHALFLVFHHICFDGWSLAIFVEEIMAAYGALARGLPPRLPPLPMRYADYAAGERTWMQSPAKDRQLDYWHEVLAGIEPLELTTDRPRPPIQDFAGRHHVVNLDPESTLRLKALATEHDATLFMVLMAGFQAVLHRYTGQTGFGVSTPVAGRRRHETERLIGFFLNNVVVRYPGPGEHRFEDFVDQIRDGCLEAFDHDGIPFNYLVESIEHERDASRPPLAQALFILQNAPYKTLAIEGVTIDAVGIANAGSKYDLSLVFSETDVGLEGYLEYRTSLFDDETAARLGAHLRRFYESVARDPRQAITEVPLLDADEENQVLRAWNDTERQYDLDGTVTDAIQACLDVDPEKVILETEEDRMTRGELNAASNRLAHLLIKEGVQPGNRVGVYLARGLDLVVSILGILKCGAVYVPLDTSYPLDRVAYMAQDSGCRLVLTDAETQPATAAWPVVGLCVAEAPMAQQPSTRPCVTTSPEDLIYVYYTSGSTGRPKGAMNRHRGVLNRLRWHEEAFQMCPDDRVLQKTPISFDVSVWEVLWPLMHGGVMVLPPAGLHQDPPALARFIRDQRITITHFVPSMMQLFLEETGAGACKDLRAVFSSGEALSPQLRDRFYTILPHAALHNVYGPTENSVDSTHWPCVPDERCARIPIGRPIANVRTFVLDERQRPVPVGVPGELCIGGVGLGLGYIGDEEATAKAWVAISHPAIVDQRLYRTGDRARWRPDGVLEYLGRLDAQVKIRGYRVELGEVEAALRADEAVRDAVVVARGATSADLRLDAYVIPERDLDVGDLRTGLRERLPDYMVPTAIVVLETFPLNPNGKVNRRALPEPRATDRDSHGHEFVSPRNELEASLRETWADILGVEAGAIGVQDDFFALGGHSLRATQLVGRVRRRWDPEFTLRMLFSRPTIAAMADSLRPRIVEVT